MSKGIVDFLKGITVVLIVVSAIGVSQVSESTTLQTVTPIGVGVFCMFLVVLTDQVITAIKST